MEYTLTLLLTWSIGTWLTLLLAWSIGTWLCIQVLCGLYTALGVDDNELHLLPEYDKWYMKLFYITPLLIKKFRQNNISY